MSARDGSIPAWKRAETKRLLDSVNDTHPKLMKELLPKLMSLGEMQKGPSTTPSRTGEPSQPRRHPRDHGRVRASVENVIFLTEHIRQALGRALICPLLDNEGGLQVLTLERSLEEQIIATFDPEGAARMLGTAPRPTALGNNFLRPLLESVKRLTGEGMPTALHVLLCPSPARYHLRRWLEPFLPRVTVLAPSEIPPEVRVRSVGTVGDPLTASS